MAQIYTTFQKFVAGKVFNVFEKCLLRSARLHLFGKCSKNSDTVKYFEMLMHSFRILWWMHSYEINNIVNVFNLSF